MSEGPTATATATKPDETSTGLISDVANGHGDNSDEILQQWLELARTGGRTATGTVRKFADTVDRVVPLDGVGLPKRRELMSAALEMTERLIQSEYDLVRSLVQSAVFVNVGVDVDVDVDVASRAPTA
jgi:hypothetical protein